MKILERIKAYNGKLNYKELIEFINDLNNKDNSDLYYENNKYYMLKTNTITVKGHKLYRIVSIQSQYFI